jgi:Peptidase family M28
MKPARAVIFLLAFAAIGLAQQSGITPEALRTWLTYIASDDLEGRATFSEGLGLAAAYIAEQLKSAGVKPAGDHGTYFQRVEVLGVKSTNRSSVTVEVNGQKRTFKNLEGVRFASNVGGKRTVTFDKVQFVGYGVNLGPEHDDYRGIDVKGKAVLWLGSRGPKTDQQANRLLRARADYATQEMGAGATITPPPDTIVGQRGARGGGAPVAPAQQTARGAVIQPDFTTTQVLDHEIPPNIAATDEFMDFLFSGSDWKYADLRATAQLQGDLPKFELKGVTLTFNLDADYQVVNTRYTRNVVGIVEGTDPRLKSTYVAFGAHYDHTGYTQGLLPAGQTDRINNGADDDGSGTVTLIGLARAFATGPKTKRSEIFVWHAGEELGLYGSEYFADHPEVPLDRIVAQLNIDMVGRNHDNLESESNVVYTVGADRISSELHNVLIDVNSALPKPMTLNFQLNDPTDAERIYYRSDHYSYAAKGIPIIFFTTFLHPDYHRPSDEVDKINFDKMARIANLVYETGRRLANMDHAPVRDFKGPRVGKGGQGKIVTSN